MTPAHARCQTRTSRYNTLQGMTTPDVEGRLVSYSLVCKDCKHKFVITCACSLPDEERVCPSCGSRRVRQRLSGLLRNLDVAAYDGEKLRPKKCA